MKINACAIAIAVPSQESSIVLVVYFLIFCCVVIAVSRYKKKALQSMERAHATEPELSLYQVAFLAGGAPRAMQTAILCLYQQQLIRVKTFLFQRMLKPVNPVGSMPADMQPLERLLFHASCERGDLVTFRQESFRLAAAPMLSEIEIELAQYGYRPTQREHARIISYTMTPFLILCGLGSARVIYGWVHDDPIGHLVILVMLSFIVGILMSQSVPKVTVSGFRKLKSLKNNSSRPNQSDSQELRRQDAATAIAIGGVAALHAFPEYSEMINLMNTYTNTGENHSSSGGCGSFGCGGGGCGSSGCGSGCSGGD